MTKKKPSEWLPVDLSDTDLNFQVDQTNTCCGVLELGCFSTSRNPFSGVTVSSRATKTETTHKYSWSGPSRGYITIPRQVEVPAQSRKATYEEVLCAFKKEQQDWIKSYGMGIAWLLPVQHNGPWGRLLKDLGWEPQGKFYNPKTRHTLVMYTVIWRKGPSRRKVKSILRRS